MLVMVLFGAAMLLVTLLIQFLLFKFNKNINFWHGTDLIFGMCILGIITNDAGYCAGILGYIIGDRIGAFAGWHQTK